MTCVWYEDYIQVASVAVLSVATVAGVAFNLKSKYRPQSLASGCQAEIYACAA